MTTEQKKISVKELQTFIEAVEFAADTEEWIPSARQWKRIRQMIDNLETEAIVRQVINNTVAPVHRAPDRPVIMAPQGMPTTFQGVPTPPSSPAFGMSTPIGVPAKTPDIDTSAGGYNSTFA